MKNQLKVLFPLILVGTFTVLLLSVRNQAKTSVISVDEDDTTEALFSDVDIAAAILEVSEVEETINGKGKE